MRPELRLNFFVRRAIPLVICAIFLAGCAGEASRPASAYKPVVTSEPWSYGSSTTARTINSPHYSIHTTLTKPEFAESLAQLMEACYGEYQAFAPGVPASSRPLECYIFQNRSEWVIFTADKTGDDAALYLQINRGGYTVRDWFVAFDIGEVGTYAVAAHEGWHQYVARHFKSRLPPFLEEGIATMFENVRFYGSAAPEFDLSPRTHRARKLREAIESNSTFPLEQLLTMHAGDVVAMKGDRIEAFYAQGWAFAEFLYDCDNAKYRPALQKLLSDCAAGIVYDPSGASRHSIVEGWNPHTVKPMIEHYLGMDLPAIDQAYQTYCRRIAFAGPKNDRQ